MMNQTDTKTTLWKNRNKAYVVLSGLDGVHGVFTSFLDSHAGAGDGVSNHVKQGDHGCVWRAFESFEAAKATYDELLRNGIQQTLTLPATPNESFVVYRGARPGVYYGRQKFVSKGLGWRSGGYRRFESKKDARNAFTSYKTRIDLIEQALQEEKERKDREVQTSTSDSEGKESKTGDALAGFDQEFDTKWASLTDEQWAALLQEEKDLSEA
ncbi:hypothetical protein K435DRAFT_806483 [Dendrothele bispora CBS 962.96]|uniref:Uncharacterized protein n=1 Tax=Dendrothele bispora (strain CBS 962.96) TaxID=1314807 RepID=A0A4S8L7S9_DENBC|nr:hypothetical protein K435DRAFT_806483 [Dendrothele bispora CBS 962.96]